ncbi:MAG: 50S ribosomal protein L11 methyltransferase [Gammaproteobacteria bacterium]|nr:50S ribosomal protein L11 methyltransferase [Gammaproteobacteria bacterium]
MSWLQIELSISAPDAERVEAALCSAGALSVTFGDAGDSPIYQADIALPPLWTNTRVSGLFPAATDIDSLRVYLLAALGLQRLPEHRVQLLEDREWAREWLKDFKPMRFGKRLWICPTTHSPPDPGAVNIRLDPGLAFGTGTHATTALCLEWLEANELAGKTVIDYGCGSGILAIAAVHLGAKRAWAVDIDPQALTATHANAAHNQVQDRLEISPPGELKILQVDVLLANILAGPLRELAPHFAGLVRPGGRLLLSGILSSQRDEIERAYARWFQSCAVTRREEWLIMEYLRRKIH